MRAGIVYIPAGPTNTTNLQSFAAIASSTFGLQASCESKVPSMPVIENGLILLSNIMNCPQTSHCGPCCVIIQNPSNTPPLEPAWSGAGPCDYHSGSRQRKNLHHKYHRERKFRHIIEQGSCKSQLDEDQSQGRNTLPFHSQSSPSPSSR